MLMSKFLLFYLVLMLTGNPILAILLLVVIFYALDRRYVGLFPSVTKPFRRWMRISHLQKQLSINPHDSPAKYDLAQALIQIRKFQSALNLLQDLPSAMRETADVEYDTGLCQLSLGKVKDGEVLILHALSMDARLRYGEPYLKLATALAPTAPEQALQLLKEFQTHNLSSCESYYRMAMLYRSFGNPADAREAWQQCLQTYRVLPKFRKRVERRWALLARIQLLLGSR